jgi:hypothetical protein
MPFVSNEGLSFRFSERGKQIRKLPAEVDIYLTGTRVFLSADVLDAGVLKVASQRIDDEVKADADQTRKQT